MTTTLLRLTRLAAAATLLAAACDDASAPESSLDAARKRWARTAPASYEVTVQRLCFCIDLATKPIVVTVRDGVVESRRYAANGATVDPQFARNIPTVDELFGVIEDALRRNAARLDATYDPQRGFPTAVDIDYDTRLADEEVSFRVTAFRPR